MSLKQLSRGRQETSSVQKQMVDTHSKEDKYGHRKQRNTQVLEATSPVD